MSWFLFVMASNPDIQVKIIEIVFVDVNIDDRL
jgi:hypothetical protein